MPSQERRREERPTFQEGSVNVRRIAALLRELAEALEQQDEQPKPKRRPLASVPAPTARPEVVAKVRRNLRRAGIVA